MTVRGLLSISSLTMLLMGIVFFLFPEHVRFNEIQDPSEKEKLIVIINKQIISGIFLFVGILLLVARRNVTSAARRILFGSSIGFFIIISIQVKLYFIENIIINLPIFIIFSVLCILSFYVSYLKKY
tara:strand:+ start:314 stop:694 length:381 start_codon:yes stop_codon:yes gene_type:complete